MVLVRLLLLLLVQGEEDIIMARVTEIVRQKLKERSSRDTRSLKEVLVYLMYLEMLGHETGWAQAAVIQMCSEKNLVVKKVRGRALVGDGRCRLGDAGRRT